MPLDLPRVRLVIGLDYRRIRNTFFVCQMGSNGYRVGTIKCVPACTAELSR
jgi:hypothetical protein